MDISKSSVQELKAIAYDIMADITRLNQNLQLVQQTIAKKISEDEKKEPKTE